MHIEDYRIKNLHGDMDVGCSGLLTHSYPLSDLHLYGSLRMCKIQIFQLAKLQITSHQRPLNFLQNSQNYKC